MLADGALPAAAGARAGVAPGQVAVLSVVAGSVVATVEISGDGAVAGLAVLARALEVG